MKTRLSKTRRNTNVLQGKITCGCKSIMHQKVNQKPTVRVNQYVCKNNACNNTINREWLYEMVRLVVKQHVEKSELDKILYTKTIELLNKEILFLKNQIQKKEKRRNKMWANKPKYIKSLGEQLYYSKLKGIKMDLEELNPKHINSMLKRDSLKNAFKSKRKRFSENYEDLKLQIKDILDSVIIKKNEVDINIFGWRIYTLFKPNSTLLAWDKRDINKKYEYKLPQRHYWSEEDDLANLIYQYFNQPTEEELEEHFKSDKYKGVPSLGKKNK